MTGAGARRTEGRAQTRTRVGERVLLSIMLACVALFGCAAVAAARDMDGGVARERAAMHALAGTGWTFDTIAWCVSRVPAVTVLVGCLVGVALVVRRSRRLAVMAGVLMGGANVSAQVIKDALACVLTPAAASVPSGHAVLALTSACALVMIAPERWRAGALVLAGALATLGCTGVVAAYWHVPGDVLAALVLVACWVGIVRLWGRDPRMGVSRRDAALGLAGAAWTIVTFLGWGTGVNSFTVARDVAAGVELVVVPSLAALLVAFAARGLPGSSEATH